MKLIFTSYVSSPEYSQPDLWLKRIGGYTGILESLSRNNTVIGIERINYEGEYEQNGVQYFFIRLKCKIARLPFRMHRLIKGLQPDVVFINGFIFPLQIIQLRWKLGKGIKIVVINHAERPYKGFRKLLQHLADRCVHSYLFTSKEMGAEWVQQGIIANDKKITGVMEASSFFSVADKEKARTKTGITGDPVFLWVGRLDANKDPLTVIKAFGEFIKYQQSAKMYMIYHTTDLKRDIDIVFEQDTGLQKAIIMIGRIPHEEMQWWYSSADFIVSGSHYEGSGVAVCEAMSCGCVPVITDIISFRKMTGYGKCGLLYEPGNDEALLKALLQTQKMDMEEERQKVFQQFKKELSFEAIAGKIDKVISCL